MYSSVQPAMRGPDLQDQDPLPATAMLGEAWQITFRNLGVFFPVALLEVLGAVAFGALTFVVERSFVVSARPLVYTNAQWFLTRCLSGFGQCVFTMPYEAAASAVSLLVIQRAAAPLDGLRAFGRFFVPAFLYGLLMQSVLTMFEFLVRLYIPEFASLLNIIVAAVVAIPFMLVIPSMVRYEYSLTQAIQYSTSRVMRNPFSFTGYSIGAGILAISGVIGCGIGVLFTICVARVAMMLLFAQPTRQAYLAVNSPYPRYTGEAPTF